MQAFIDVCESKATIRLFAWLFNLFLQILQIGFLHPHAVICHRQYQQILFLFSTDTDLSFGALAFDPMIQCIFYDWLQCHFRNLIAIELRIY